MAKSYVGIISQEGLLALVSEETAVSTFLAGCLRSTNSTSLACCWTVLDDNAASEVLLYLQAGEPRAALEALSNRAEHLGAWLPSSKITSAMVRGTKHAEVTLSQWLTG